MGSKVVRMSLAYVEQNVLFIYLFIYLFIGMSNIKDNHKIVK
jgi:hypothetical protein